MTFVGSPFLRGVAVHIIDHIGWRTYQYRYPKSKKVRIRKKFRKKYMRTVQDPVCYEVDSSLLLYSRTGKMMVMNTAAFKQLEKKFKIL